MKTWLKKIGIRPIIVSVFMLALLVITMLIPVITFSDGCPPQETCSDGWKADPKECWLDSCDEFALVGYCILCKPKV